MPDKTYEETVMAEPSLMAFDPLDGSGPRHVAISHVAVRNVPLSSSDVAAYYAAGGPVPATGPGTGADIPRRDGDPPPSGWRDRPPLL